MKRVVFSILSIGAVLMSTSVAFADGSAPTSSGSLTVSATISPSISLYFVSDSAGVPLTNTGTNAAALSFGTISAYGAAPTTGVTRTLNDDGTGGSNFTVSSPFDIYVILANETSAGYTLAATLATADTTNTWKIDGTADISGGSSTPITGTGTYGSNVPHTLSIQIPFTNTTGSLSNSVSFVATAQ